MSTNKKIGLRLDDKQLAILDKLATKSGKSPQDIIRDLINSQESTVEPECVGEDKPEEIKEGDKLPLEYDFLPHYETKVGTNKYVYFPGERILAVKKRTANWSQSWYEVVQVFTDEEVKDIEELNWHYKLLELVTKKQVLASPVVAAVLDKMNSLGETKLVKKVSALARKGLKTIQEFLAEEYPEYAMT